MVFFISISHLFLSFYILLFDFIIIFFVQAFIYVNKLYPFYINKTWKKRVLKWTLPLKVYTSFLLVSTLRRRVKNKKPSSINLYSIMIQYYYKSTPFCSILNKTECHQCFKQIRTKWSVPNVRLFTIVTI